MKVKRRQIRQAVWMRGHGKTWDEIADELGVEKGRVVRWPMMFPEIWSEFLTVYTPIILHEAELESTIVLRKLLRDPEPKTQYNAARTLLHHRVETLKLQQRKKELFKKIDISEIDPDYPHIRKWYDDYMEMLNDPAIQKEGEEAVRRAEEFERKEREEKLLKSMESDYGML
jgi:hypothetical protein